MASARDRILGEVHPDEVVEELAKDLVRIKSYTTDETPVAEFLHGYLRKQGFESQLQEVDPGRFQTVARLPGRGGGQSLMYDGHIDIDPIPGGWTRDPWTPTIEGDRFYGAGIYNMKGGVAAMVMAAVAARRAGVPLRGDVWLACVVGELQGGVARSTCFAAGTARTSRSCPSRTAPRTSSRSTPGARAARPRGRPLRPHLPDGARGQRHQQDGEGRRGARGGAAARRAGPGPPRAAAPPRGQHRRRRAGESGSCAGPTSCPTSAPSSSTSGSRRA